MSMTKTQRKSLVRKPKRAAGRGERLFAGLTDAAHAAREPWQTTHMIPPALARAAHVVGKSSVGFDDDY